VITVQRQSGRIELAGELDHASVAQLLLQSADWFGGEALNISLQGVTQSDSAGLALLLEWQKIARQKQVTIQYHALPEQLRNIARAYGVDSLLPLAA
jgi:phospholipid transport system transporter-binding protein